MSITVKNNILYHNKVFTIPSCNLRLYYPKGKVIVANHYKLNEYANIIAEINYNKGVDANGEILAFVNTAHKNHEFEYDLSYIQIGVLRPIMKVDIPDVSFYHINGLYGPGVRYDLLNLLSDSLKRQINSLVKAYGKVLGATKEEIYIYYSRGNYNKKNHGMYANYYGSSVGKVDFYKITKDYKKLKTNGKNVYAINCGKLLEFLDMDKLFFENSAAWNFLQESEELIKNTNAQANDKIQEVDKVSLAQMLEEVPTDSEPEKIDSELIAKEKNVYYNSKLVQEINEIKEKLQGYISDEDMKKIEKLVTYMHQIYSQKMKFYGVCNFIMYSEDSERLKETVDILNEYCFKKKASRICKIEEEEIDDIDELDDFNIINIYNCIKEPFVDPNAGTGTVKVQQEEIYKKYIERWNNIKEYIKNNNDKIYILTMDNNVFKNTFRKNKELLSHLISNVVYVNPISEDEIVNRVIAEFNDFYYGVSDDFADAIKKYVKVSYSRSLSRSDEYITELRQKIMTKYYSTPQKEKAPISAECLPSLNIKSTDEIMKEINQLYGLGNVKETFNRLCNAKQFDSLRSNGDMKSRYHMVFTGNPGTGKTTVARMLADMLYSMGLIKTNNLVEKRAAEFTSGWSGVTHQVVESVISEARDGVLFIDEAYAIMNLDGNRRNQVIDLLMKSMDTEPVVMIFAGYEEEINELLKMNPGIKSRMGYFVHFDDYKKEELFEIFKNKLTKMDYRIEPGAIASLEECVLQSMSDVDFGNARGIESLCQKVDDEYKNLIISKVKKDDKILDSEIFKKIMPPRNETNLDNLVGIKQAKAKLDEFKKAAIYEKHAKKAGLNIPSSPKHMIFTGNPGTGKTTVARVFAQELYNAGVIPTNKTIVLEPKDLAGNSRESGSQVFKKKLREAKGGVLFIDEAYAITNKGTIDGLNIIEHLLTAMLDHKDDIIFIFAGYPNEMNDFMDTNPGLKSRIGTKIHFKDYTPNQLVEIFKRNIEKIGYKYDKEILEEIYNIVQYFDGLEELGNARFVDNLISLMKLRKSKNMYNYRDDVNYNEKLMKLNTEDIPTLMEVYKSLPGNENFASPEDRNAEEWEKTVIHELGHAVVGYVLPYGRNPVFLYFVQNYLSYGRVMLENKRFSSKLECESEISALLAGRNMEKLVYGYNSNGCSSDYYKARLIAHHMVNDWAMTDRFAIGDEAINDKIEEILEDASKKTDEILTKYMPFILELKDKIMNDDLECMKNYTIKGCDFEALIEKYKADNNF